MWKDIVAPVALVILFWGLSSIASAWYIHWLEASQSQMILEDLGTIRATGEMRYDVRLLEWAAANSTRPASAKSVAQIEAIEQEFRGHYRQAVATSLAPAEQVLDHEIDARYQAYSTELWRQMRQSAASEASQTEENRARLGLANQLADAARRLGDLNEQSMQRRGSPRSLFNAAFSAIHYGLFIVGPLAGILCGFWIARRFSRSISRISVTLDDAALEIPRDVGRIDVRRKSDLPRIQQQVNRVVARIREVNHELRDARRQAISAARLAAVGEMAAGVAHEIRNPLTSVKLLIQTAFQRPDRALTEKQFQVVLQEVSRMETTVEQLLDFARPPQMSYRRQDLRVTVADAVAVVEGRAQHGGVSLALDAPPAPVEIDADAGQLHQVFNNLLQNGIEAMPGGGILRITVRGTSAPGDSCAVEIADSGAGIPESLMGRLFEPFATDKARGTGLGLAISRRIVEDHGGQLTATNRPEGGAAFTVELPGAAEGPPSVRPQESAHDGRAQDQAVMSAVTRLSPEHDHAQTAGH